MRAPEQLATLREQPEMRGNCVDEVLCFDPPVVITVRTAVEEVELGGRTIRPKQMLALLLTGANRYPAVFENPERFDVARENASDHLAFSAGRQFCLGATLARMESEVGILRGYKTLPATLSVRA